MSVILREATGKDIDLLYYWVNDESVRKSAFNSRMIDYDEHKTWFEKKLIDVNNYIFILELDDIPIGQIRVDIKEYTGIIDYSIDENFRGRGYGAILLTKLEEKIKQKGIKLDKLIGEVKNENIISQKAFIKLGYVLGKSSGFVELVKAL